MRRASFEGRPRFSQVERLYVDVTRIAPHQTLELYISPSCPYCAQAMEHYDSQGAQYVAHDAQNDQDARKRMLAFAGGDPTVPAIVIDGLYVQSGWGTPPRG